MDVMLTLNFWFIVSLCLASLVLGAILGCWMVGSRHKDHLHSRW